MTKAGALTNIRHLRREFAEEVVGGTTLGKMASNAIVVALQHNPTYAIESGDREQFRAAFQSMLIELADSYQEGVGAEAHCKNIEHISNQLSLQFGAILKGGRLRIGTAQKALNVFVKSLWCAFDDYPAPPHCPLDSIVLEGAGVYGKWTALDSMDTYRKWMRRVEEFALEEGFQGVAEWELVHWQASTAKDKPASGGPGLEAQ